MYCTASAAGAVAAQVTVRMNETTIWTPNTVADFQAGLHSLFTRVYTSSYCNQMIFHSRVQLSPECDGRVGCSIPFRLPAYILFGLAEVYLPSRLMGRRHPV